MKAIFLALLLAGCGGGGSDSYQPAKCGVVLSKPGGGEASCLGSQS